MDLGLAQRTVLVAGATGGIGTAVALRFAEAGGRLALTFHRAEDEAWDLAGRCIEIGASEATAVRLDLTDLSSIEAAVGSVTARRSSIDVLVNAAVVWPPAPSVAPAFADERVEQWRSTIRATLEGTYRLIQLVAPTMAMAGWGRIVTLSSTMASDGQAGAAAYGAAKGALEGLHASLVHELAPLGILTNVVAPGLTVTERLAARRPPELLAAVTASTPTGRMTTADDVAAAVAFLASEANGNITGEVVRVAGGR